MNQPRTIVVATGNAHKLEEIRDLLHGLPVRLLTLTEAGVAGDLVEDGITFEENAGAKAAQASAATGLWALADDSGLEVDVLGGLPGVHSARYAGRHGDDEANNRKLLDELREGGHVYPLARFRCCAALRLTEEAPSAERLVAAGLRPLPGGRRPADVSLDRRTITVNGAVEGTIVDAPRGDGGFGYDPLFLLPHLEKTMAELAPAEKNGISHRAEAFRRMAPVLEALIAAEAAPR